MVRKQIVRLAFKGIGKSRIFVWFEFVEYYFQTIKKKQIAIQFSDIYFSLFDFAKTENARYLKVKEKKLNLILCCSQCQNGVSSYDIHDILTETSVVEN